MAAGTHNLTSVAMIMLINLGTRTSILLQMHIQVILTALYSRDRTTIMPE
jgi:hypothetical protein